MSTNSPSPGDLAPLSRAHLKPLTSLRFFAAAAIVLFHMKDILPWSRPSALAQGVSFFFVLSGFILAYNYTDKIRLPEFYINRIARIWPVHLFCFVLVILAVKVPALSFRNAEWIAAANILMVQAWFPVVGVPFSFNGPSWSISAEFAFYLLFPLLLRARPFWLVYVILASSVIGAVYYLGTLDWPKPPRPFTPHLVHIIWQHPAIRILEFATGIAAARIFFKMAPPRYGNALEIGCLAAMIVFWSFGHDFARFFENQALLMWAGESGGGLLYAVAILIFAWGKGFVSHALSWRGLVVLGEISFCTYMLHQIVIRWYLAQKLDWHWAAGAVFVIVVTYGGSWLMWRFVEKPARRKLVELGSRVHSIRRTTPPA